MEKTRSISPFQLFSIMSVSSIFCSVMYSQYTVKQTDLLTYAVASLAAIAILLIIMIPLLIFKKKADEYNIIKAIQIKKPILSGIFYVIYILYFMYSAAASLVMFSFMLSNFINPELPFFIFFFLSLCCCYYSASKGLTTIGRASSLFFIVISLIILSSYFSLIFRINTQNYSYIFVENTDGIFENIAHIISLTSPLPAAFLILPKTEGSVKKTFISWIVYSNLFVFLLSVISFGVLGEYFKLTPYPFYTATQLIEVGAFQRLDVFFISLWIVGMFVNVSFLLYAIKETLQSAFCAEKVKYLNPLTAVAIGIISLFAANFEAVRSVILNTKIILVLFLAAAFVFPLIAVLAVGKRRMNSTLAKGVSLLIVAILFIPLLSGCQQTQLQDKMIIKGVGIDKSDDQYFVTVQYIDNYADGDAQENKCIQVSGSSVGEAIGIIKDSSGSEPFLGQNVAIIVGWDTAKGSMDSILDYFIRYSDTRPTVNLYISETTAEDILTLEISGSILPIDHLTSISPSQSDNDNLFTILDFINQSNDPTDTPTASLIHVDNNTIRLSSVAVFGKESGVYKLDKNEFIAYKTILGIEDGTVLSFDGISGRVTNCSTNVIAKELNGKLDFDVSCSLDITILENPDNFSDEKIREVYNENLDKITNDSLEKSLNENSCDIYSLGRHLKFGDYKKYSDSELYTESLKSCNAKAIINCEIVDTTR